MQHLLKFACSHGSNVKPMKKLYSLLRCTVCLIVAMTAKANSGSETEYCISDLNLRSQTVEQVLVSGILHKLTKRFGKFLLDYHTK